MNAVEKRNYKPTTLCELCTKACGFCPWSKYGVQRPVEGWTAIRRDLLDAGESYVVLECPLFNLEEGLEWALERFDHGYIKERVDSSKREQEVFKERHRRRRAVK